MQNDLWGRRKFLIFATDECDADNNSPDGIDVQLAALGATTAEGGGCGNAGSCGWSQRGQQGLYSPDGLDGMRHRVRQLQDARILARQL